MIRTFTHRCAPPPAKIMKLLFDFLPILIFFIAYELYDIYVATAAAMAVAVAHLAWSWYREHRIENLQWVVVGSIVVLGGATLLFHDDTFIKWKPTVVNWAFALAFLISHYVGDRSILHRLMAENISLPTPIWRRLNWSWIVFFFIAGVLNLYVAFSGHFDQATWVKFKLFGMTGLTFIFFIGQAFYLSRHIKSEPNHDTQQGR
jgi:intracellular septation protein